jgi:hypothetical protein
VQEISTSFAAAGGSGGLGVYDDGSAVVAWEKDEGPSDFGTILWSERTATGAWSSPTPFDFPAHFCSGPEIACNGSALALAFGASGSGIWLVVMTRNERGGWSAYDTTCATRNPGGRSVGLDKDGHVIAVWANNVDGQLRIGRRDSAWAQLLIADSLFPNISSVAVDADGHVDMAWSSEAYFEAPTDIYYIELEASDFPK